jgi:thiamine pyrophosphate-dependent acetolactate synthase large subunit-like protein
VHGGSVEKPKKIKNPASRAIRHASDMDDGTKALEIPNDLGRANVPLRFYLIGQLLLMAI